MPYRGGIVQQVEVAFCFFAGKPPQLEVYILWEPASPSARTYVFSIAHPLPPWQRQGRSFALRGRVTFALGGKSNQKRHLNLRFKNPPALFSLQICGLMPRVHRTWLISFRVTNRLSSCAAAAHLRNDRTNSVIRQQHQRQRRRGVKKTCRWHVFSLRSRRLCRRSIHLSFHSKT